MRDHSRHSGVGIAALVLGVVAVLTACVPLLGEILALLPALGAIAFGIVGVRHHETGRAAGAGMAVVGAVLGGFSLAIVGLLFALSIMP
ncbi:hypothetical protein [Microbacterium suaedae]|uniref:hypothetical protein n=1 Tax=Microbacterium suaedae TaxID=2067813 RepID=UPI000DAC6D7C|nr:hypothetical protein [Microbacterium suaedae]